MDSFVETEKEFFCQEFEFEESKKQDNGERLTKKQKKEQKDIKYENGKKDTRLKYSEKKKEKKQKVLDQFENEEQKQQYLDSRKNYKREKKEKGKEAQKSKLKVVIDCSYDDLMEEREVKSLARQISELYSKNRSTMTHPASLHLTGVTLRLQQYLDLVGFTNWFILWTDQDFYKHPDLVGQDFIYLTPDSQIELEEVDENSIYIIGGLVDRTIIKDATLNRANLLNIKSRKLPIGHLIKPSYKKALNVSTAALFLCEYLNSKDWEKTFNMIVPKKFNKDVQKIEQI